MTKDGGRRVATADGAMLLAQGADALPGPGETPFEPDFWRARGALTAVTRGRGSTWFIGAGSGQWALRHYRRGGWIGSRISLDRYLWEGEARVRAFAEWRLLAALAQLGLPVPAPIAARYRCGWLTYRCDLITRRIPDAKPLSDAIAAGRLSAPLWRAVGATVARFHAAGVDHADLNAHNILLGPGDSISVVDFDRGRLREPGSWRAGNLSRFQRSLRKISRALPAGRFSAADWDEFMAGYRKAREPGT